MVSRLAEQILLSLNREVLNELDLTKSIAHPGENGRAREQILTEFFRKLLPRSFGISTGFVFDAVGNISKQIDLVIYRNDYHPIFEIGGIKHFLVESVVAVIENKASITSRDKLKDALDNLKSVKQLDRTNDGKNYTLVGSKQGEFVDAGRFEHQIFGAILTEQSMTKESVRHELLNYLQPNPRNYWPNIYADVRNFAAFYLNSIASNVTTVPINADCLALTDSQAENYVPPLVQLASEVCNFLRVSPLIDYSTVDYLLANSGKVDWWRI